MMPCWSVNVPQICFHSVNKLLKLYHIVQVWGSQLPQLWLSAGISLVTQCWFHEVEISAMHSYTPLGFNQLLNVGCDHWLQICIVGICQWVYIMVEGCLLLFGPCFQFWMLADKLTELSRNKLKKLELDSPSLWVINWPLNWLTEWFVQ